VPLGVCDNWRTNFGGRAPKILGAKNFQNSARFRTTFFTSIANISGTDQDIKTPKINSTREFGQQAENGVIN